MILNVFLWWVIANIVLSAITICLVRESLHAYLAKSNPLEIIGLIFIGCFLAIPLIIYIIIVGSSKE